ncbi:MAG: hypothetical protein V4487_00265 [Chlamydiota bacterium]
MATRILPELNNPIYNTLSSLISDNEIDLLKQETEQSRKDGSIRYWQQIVDQSTTVKGLIDANNSLDISAEKVNSTVLKLKLQEFASNREIPLKESCESLLSQLVITFGPFKGINFAGVDGIQQPEDRDSSLSILTAVTKEEKEKVDFLLRVEGLILSILRSDPFAIKEEAAEKKENRTESVSKEKNSLLRK